MADNYLEKKFEEYLSTKRAKPRRGEAKTKAVLITDGLCSEGKALVKRHCARGDTAVAFCATDLKRGYALAQASGARFYPLGPLSLGEAIADARKHWPKAQLEIIHPEKIDHDKTSLTSQD